MTDYPLRQLNGRLEKVVTVTTSEKDERGIYVFRDGDGEPFMWGPRPERYEFHNVSTVAEADHVSFLCPLCFARNGGAVGTHSVFVSFAGRAFPEEAGSRDSDGKPSRWNASGAIIEDLVLTPSILLDAERSPDQGCHWHGFVGSSGVPPGHAGPVDQKEVAAPMTTEHSHMKLGKRPPRRREGTPLMAKYAAALPAPPAAVSWAGKLTTLGAMGNDRLGDCTCAALGHAIQTWTSQAGGEATIPDAAVLAVYEAVGGYVPGEPQTDRGAVIYEVLAYWMKNPVGGHAQPYGFAYVAPGDTAEVKDAIYWFGGCDIGLALPVSAQSQDVWDVPAGGPTGPGAPDSWGGHSVFVVGYDAEGLTCVTWGQLKRMTWAFWSTYCDEAWAILAPDWVQGDAPAPDGFPLAQLQQDMLAIEGGLV